MNYTSYKLLCNIDVACSLDEARQREAIQYNQNLSRYTKMIHHNIDAALFSSAQELLFRGYGKPRVSANPGNFIELMDLVASYSHELRFFLDTERVTYTSHSPQIDIFHYIAEEVCGKIQNRFNASMYVSVMT